MTSNSQGANGKLNDNGITEVIRCIEIRSQSTPSHAKHRARHDTKAQNGSMMYE